MTLKYSSLDQAPIFPGQFRLLSGLTYEFDSKNGFDVEEFEIGYQVLGPSIKGPKKGTMAVVIGKE